MESVRKHTAWLLLALFLISALGVVAFTYRLQTRLVTVMALQSAAAYSQALTEFRTLYTSEVVARAQQHGVVAAHDYESRPNAIPLPATLSMLLGQRIGASGSGVQTQLYSAFPFPWRSADGGLRDPFRNEAWGHFVNGGSDAFYRFETVNGRPSLRYATADVMRPSCVECHNTHEASPKTDWTVGAVRGVLEIDLPLDAATAQARSGLRGSLALLLLLATTSLIGLGLVVNRSRHDASALLDSESRFRQLIEGSIQGILIHREGKPVFANQAFATIFGYDSSEEILALDSLDRLIPPPYNGSQGTRHDGTVVWLESTLRDIEWQGQACVQITSVDISQRKQLERELLAVIAREQRRLGYDLHDGLGQQLTGISLMSKALERDLGEDHPELAAHAQKIVDNAQDAIRQSRRLVEGLVPVELDDRGLVKVLQQFATRTAGVFDGVQISVRASGKPDFELDVALHLYRVVQEAVHNAIRHGGATHVTIDVRGSVEGPWTLSIIDDGTWKPVTQNGGAVDPSSTTPTSMGLRVMQYRANLIGATLAIDPAHEGGGTAVRCTLPRTI